MKTAILVMSAGLLFAGQTASAQAVPLVPQALMEDGFSSAPPLGHCQEISARDAKMLPLSQLCEFSQTYLRKLPDFICQQTTTEKKGALETVVNAQVTFVKGEEIYSDVTTDSRPLEDTEAAGTGLMSFRSEGEFGLFLVNLFKAPIVAKFKPAKTSNLDGTPVTVYDFNVPAEKSFWRVRDGKGRVVTPGVRGQISLERKTGRLLKLVLQPVDLPPGFEATWIRTTINYAPTSLGDAGVFVLPVKSETTVCGWWENSQCPRHVMTFHDCHKFAASTRIVAEAPEP